MCHQMFVGKCAVCKTVTVGDLDVTLHALTHEESEEGELIDYVDEDDEDADDEYFVESDYSRCGYCGEEYTDTQIMVHFQECAQVVSSNHSDYSRCGYCGEEYVGDTQMMLHFRECAQVASSNNSDTTAADDDGEVGGGWAGRQTGRKTCDRLV